MLDFRLISKYDILACQQQTCFKLVSFVNCIGAFCVSINDILNCSSGPACIKAYMF